MIERVLLTLHPGLSHDSRVPRSARDLRHRSYISLTGQLRPLDRASSRGVGVPAEEIWVWRGRSCLAHRHLMKVRSRKFALDFALEGAGFEPSVPFACIGEFRISVA